MVHDNLIIEKIKFSVSIHILSLIKMLVQSRSEKSLY